jgi:hypothetical protein
MLSGEHELQSNEDADAMPTQLRHSALNQRQKGPARFDSPSHTIAVRTRHRSVHKLEHQLVILHAPRLGWLDVPEQHTQRRGSAVASTAHAPLHHMLQRLAETVEGDVLEQPAHAGQLQKGQVRVAFDRLLACPPLLERKMQARTDKLERNVVAKKSPAVTQLEERPQRQTTEQEVAQDRVVERPHTVAPLLVHFCAHSVV